ncbi:unnamed protein product [Phaedon cochleariae]|uniref:Uncharacterized protein n=1 Tax=Phaedon cochleariae TaxID=80249 RepID=A0A9N9SHH7_PHACE|nr:unnamed protein product [Phaedon cochleariae]
MSSKRKSPPTKLHEGNNTTESNLPSLQPQQLGSGSEGGNLTDLDETSSNNLSDICEEDTNTMVQHPAAPFYKISGSSSPGSATGSDVDDVDDERTPPNKTARIMYSSEPNILMSSSIQALSLHNDGSERRRNSSECSSPNSDMKTNIHYNNNNSSLHNNNSFTHPLKRSMDDVLKRLTSKINSSSIREENKRPTPSSTPNSINNSDVEPTAAIQQALSGDNITEKHRKLSELILQLQMAREQLVTEQQLESDKILQEQTHYALASDYAMWNEHLQLQLDLMKYDYRYP